MGDMIREPNRTRWKGCGQRYPTRKFVLSRVGVIVRIARVGLGGNVMRRFVKSWVTDKFGARARWTRTSPRRRAGFGAPRLAPKRRARTLRRAQGRLWGTIQRSIASYDFFLREKSFR